MAFFLSTRDFMRPDENDYRASYTPGREEKRPVISSRADTFGGAMEQQWSAA